MKSFADRHPIAFGAILSFAALIPAAIIVGVLSALGMPAEISSAIARIIVGIALAIIFRELFDWDKSLSGAALAAPVLLVVAWNVLYHLVGGSGPISLADAPIALVCAFAPGLFEEVIFRGIIIGNMRAAGNGVWPSLLVSSALFALVHLTNAVGMDLPSTLVQVLYSFSVGLFLGSAYLASGDIVTAIAAHALIDLSNQVFATHPQTSSPLAIAIFCAVNLALAAYALWLARRTEKASA